MWEPDPQKLKPYVDRWIRCQDATVVRDMRQETGWGMMDCKSYLEKARLLNELRHSTTVEELRDLMVEFVHRSHWTLK